MLAFRGYLQRNKKSFEKDKVHEAMPGVPSIVIDSLVTRFTEVVRDSTKCVTFSQRSQPPVITSTNSHTPTSATETNLLTHVFALCLKVDNFATDTTVLAHDLSMQVPRYVMLSPYLFHTR
jgi:DNA-directed RNA polymerase I subunit RPA49